MNLVPALTMSVNNVATGSPAAGLGSTVALAISPGFLFGYRVNQALQIFAGGGFTFPLSGRDQVPDLFQAHLEPRFQLAPRFSVAPYVGFGVSFKDTSNLLALQSGDYVVPVGGNLLYIADPAFDVGLNFELNDVGAKTAPTWSDRRSIAIFGTFRL